MPIFMPIFMLIFISDTRMARQRFTVSLVFFLPRIKPGPSKCSLTLEMHGKTGVRSPNLSILITLIFLPYNAIELARLLQISIFYV